MPAAGISGANVTPEDAWLPADSGLQVAAGDPYLIPNTSVLTAGALYLTKLIPRSPVTINNIWLGSGSAGSGASTGSFAGIYTLAGLLAAQTADIGSLFASGNGGVQCPLTSPLAIAQPFWVGVLFNLAVTQPTLFRAGGGQFLFSNLGDTVSTYRFAINGTGLAALPASITPSANSSTGGVNLWAGVS